MSTTDSKYTELPPPSDTLFLFLFIGLLLLTPGIMISFLYLVGIPVSLIVNNVLLVLLVDFVGALLWISLLFFSIFLIDRIKTTQVIKLT